MSASGLFIHLFETYKESDISDIHFSTSSGFWIRTAGDMIPVTPDVLDQHQQSIKTLSDPKRSSIQLIQELIYLAKAADKCGGQINHRVIVLLENVLEPLESSDDSNQQAKFYLEEVLWLENNENCRITLFNSDLGAAGLALRFLPSSVPKLAQLVAPPLTKLIIDPLQKAMLRKEGGLFLVSGGTGSGKSSTLAALVDFINDNRQCNVSTLEDPIEYRHISRKAMIQHNQIGVDCPDFASGLKAVLRKDPDIILLGELRDLETMQLALTAAETGHIVLATLHARNITSAITRFVNVFPDSQQAMVRTQLAASILGIMTQRLIPSELPTAKDFGSKLLLPELVIFPVMEGGIRSIISDGRYNELTQNLTGQGSSSGSFYAKKEDVVLNLTRGGFLQ